MHIISELSLDGLNFIDKWTQKIEYINMQTTYIRKSEKDCEWMKLYKDTPQLLDQSHKGIVFDRTINKQGTYKYNVYFTHLKLFGKIKTSEEIEEFTECSFKLFYFGDEHEQHRKMRGTMEGNQGSPLTPPLVEVADN
jgi:hypothetical protein